MVYLESLLCARKAYCMPRNICLGDTSILHVAGAIPEPLRKVCTGCQGQRQDSNLEMMPSYTKEGNPGIRRKSSGILQNKVGGWRRPSLQGLPIYP